MALSEMDTTVTFHAAINQALHEEMARDPAVILLCDSQTELADPTQAAQDLRATFGKDRVITTPPGDSALVGVALGAALMGQRPVVQLATMDQVADAYNQIANLAAKLAWRTLGEMYAPIVLRGPACGGTHGGPWGSLSPEALFSSVPGLTIVLPTTPYDAKGMLKSAIRANNPVLFLEHRYLYRRLREELPSEEYLVPIGQAEVRHAGDHLSILTYGALVYHALDAAEQLAQEGISVEVLDLRTLAPLDRAAICASVCHTQKALIVHEASKTGGLGAEVAALLAEECFADLAGPIVRVAAPDLPYPAAPELEAAYLPDASTILNAARRLANW